MTRQRVRLESDAPAGALRLPTVSVVCENDSVCTVRKTSEKEDARENDGEREGSSMK